MKLRTLLSLAIITVSGEFFQSLTAAESPTGGSEWVSLFNGRDLTGWDGDPKVWSVKNGVIRSYKKPTDGKPATTFLICTNTTVGDFELHFSCRLLRGHAGIGYRCEDFGNWEVWGYQFEILSPDDPRPAKTGKLFETGSRGTRPAGVPGRGGLSEAGQKTETKPTRPFSSTPLADPSWKTVNAREWNKYSVIAQGNHITHLINGKPVTELVDLDPEHRTLSGLIALKNTDVETEAEFKDIKLKRLPPADK